MLGIIVAQVPVPLSGELYINYFICLPLSSNIQAKWKQNKFPLARITAEATVEESPPENANSPTQLEPVWQRNL